MIKRTFAWLREIIVALYIAPPKEALIDVRKFPLGLKILTWGGYVAVFLNTVPPLAMLICFIGMLCIEPLPQT